MWWNLVSTWQHVDWDTTNGMVQHWCQLKFCPLTLPHISEIYMKRFGSWFVFRFAIEYEWQCQKIIWYLFGGFASSFKTWFALDFSMFWILPWWIYTSKLGVGSEIRDQINIRLWKWELFHIAVFETMAVLQTMTFCTDFLQTMALSSNSFKLWHFKTLFKLANFVLCML